MKISLNSLDLKILMGKSSFQCNIGENFLICQLVSDSLSLYVRVRACMCV